MEQKCSEYLRGYVRIRVTGAECRRFLNLCAFHGLLLWRITPDCGAEGEASQKDCLPEKSGAERRKAASYEAFLSAADFERLGPLARKSHVRVRILQRRGFPFFLRRNRRRLAWPIGVAAALFLMAWLSAHIWSIQIEGNFSQTDDVIYEYLKQIGIDYGVKKSRVDCAGLSAQLRNYFTRFSWVSSDLSGTQLTIYVKEGTSVQDSTETEEGETVQSGDAAALPSSLAAAKAGVVVSIYVRAGLPLVEAGDEVEEGEILVTGALPVYNDDGEVASWQEVYADADIVLRTQRTYYQEISCETEQKQYTGQEKTSLAVRIGTQMFALPDSFDRLETCEISCVIRQARLFENFYLPLYLYQYTAREYETAVYTRTRAQTEEILQKDLENFIQKLAEKGVQLFENNVTIEWYEHSAAATGILTTDESAVSRVAAEHTEEESAE